MQQTIQKFNRRDVIFNISIYHTICEYYSKLLHYLLNMCILDPPDKAEYKIQHTYFLHSNYHWLIARSHVSSSHLQADFKRFLVLCFMCFTFLSYFVTTIPPPLTMTPEQHSSLVHSCGMGMV